jgi:hypothetical protein
MDVTARVAALLFTATSLWVDHCRRPSQAACRLRGGHVNTHYRVDEYLFEVARRRGLPMQDSLSKGRALQLGGD